MTDENVFDTECYIKKITQNTDLFEKWVGYVVGGKIIETQYKYGKTYAYYKIEISLASPLLSTIFFPIEYCSNTIKEFGGIIKGVSINSINDGIEFEVDIPYVREKIETRTNLGNPSTTVCNTSNTDLFEKRIEDFGGKILITQCEYGVGVAYAHYKIELLQSLPPFDLIKEFGGIIKGVSINSINDGIEFEVDIPYVKENEMIRNDATDSAAYTTYTLTGPQINSLSSHIGIRLNQTNRATNIINAFWETSKITDNIVKYNTNDNKGEDKMPIQKTREDTIRENYFSYLPRTIKIDTYNNRVVKLTFDDDTFTRAICSENDEFNLDTGITICLMKRLLGPDGHKNYNKLMKSMHSILERQEKKKEDEQKAKVEDREKKRKAELKKAAKIAKAKSDYIELHKQAYVKAMREMEED